MMSSQPALKIFRRQEVLQFTSVRAGETKVGEVIRVLDGVEPSAFESNLEKAYENGARYALVLIPEDIGPRANLGRGGADRAPSAFLNYFANMQSNRFLDCSKVLALGRVDVADLMQESASADASVETLRLLCQQIDARVTPIIRAIVKAGLEPVVIGGGNNNSYPVIQGVCEALREKGPNDLGLAVVNCDPHADFRRMEGRHSGNPFTYAHARGYLRRYCVFGLHQPYNSEEMLARLEQAGFVYYCLDDFAIRRETDFESCLEAVRRYLRRGGCPIGCELDLDSIRQMPASAKTSFGICQEEAARYIHVVASSLDTRYLHLSEAAPGTLGDDAERECGKAMAWMVTTYLKAREEFHARQVENVPAGRAQPRSGK